jgi:hypothetical protein
VIWTPSANLIPGTLLDSELNTGLSHVVPPSGPNDSIEVLSTAFQRFEVVLVMLHSTYYANTSNAREVAQS